MINEINEIITDIESSMRDINEAFSDNELASIKALIVQLGGDEDLVTAHRHNTQKIMVYAFALLVRKSAEVKK